MWVGYKGVVDKQVAVLNMKKDTQKTEFPKQKKFTQKNFENCDVSTYYLCKKTRSHMIMCVCDCITLCAYMCVQILWLQPFKVFEHKNKSTKYSVKKKTKN